MLPGTPCAFQENAADVSQPGHGLVRPQRRPGRHSSRTPRVAAGLVAAGMRLSGTLDGCFVNFAYDWALAKPVRKV